MPKPLLYNPPPRWHVWAALGGAALIHIGAVIAAIKHEKPSEEFPPDTPTAVVATLEPEEQPTPPPEDIPMPPPPPEPQVQEFHEETTPPPRRPQQAAAPIKAPQATSGVMSLSSAKAAAIFAPKPQYPYEARSRHVTGSGVVKMSVAPDGRVTDATMATSTGNPILDQAALSAYRQWRFKAGTPAIVKGPLTFTMTGVSY